MRLSKRNMAFVLSLIMVLGLAACSANAAPPAVPTAMTTPTAAVAAPTATQVVTPSPAATATQAAQPAATTMAATPTVVPKVTATAAAPPAGGGGQACKASQLSGTASWQGATGAMAGPVILINTSSTPCTLQGSPKLEILDAQGQPLDINAMPMQTNPTPAQITLQPKDKARVMFFWRNWCKQGSLGKLSVRVTLPDNGGQVVAPVQPLGPGTEPLTPRCDAPNQPSTLSIGIFEAVPVSTP